MKEKITLTDIIKSVVDMTLTSSVIDGNNPGAYKELERIENFKLEDAIKTELLVAEIFASQIPLNKFLNKIGNINLMEKYYLILYENIQNKYGYLKTREGLTLLETLIQQRFDSYYKAFEGSKDLFVSLGGEVAKNLMPGKEVNPALTLILAMLLGNKMVNIGKFLEEVSNKFEIEK